MSAVLQSQTQRQPHPLDAATLDAASLRERFNTARRAGKRAKDAAESLGASEGQAIAAHTGEHDFGLKATPLQGPWVELLQALELCGPVLALTRNESTVHEKTGVYQNISATGHMGLALGEAPSRATRRCKACSFWTRTAWRCTRCLRVPSPTARRSMTS